MTEIERNKQQLIGLCMKYVKRDGAYELLDWLENRTDFYTAPASTRFHLHEEGGLLRHSLNVYESAERIREAFEVQVPDESLVLVTLFHDLCKANFYRQVVKNVRETDPVTGLVRWTQKPCWEVADQFPVGHGEKSAILLSQFVKLTLDEIAAIRWHMGAWDSAVRGGDRGINAAFEKYPLAALLHLADAAATYFMETERESENSNG